MATTVLGGAPADAATVQLHVQAPYDLKTQHFDLHALEYQNAEAVYQDAFLLPYPQLETEVAEQLRKDIDREIHIHIRCATILCPDTDVDITVHSTFAFTQHHQPVITQVGPAKDNTLAVQLDTQAAVGVAIEIHSDTGIWKSADMNLDIQALVGVHAGATLTLWPTLAASDVKVQLSHDGGNVDVSGLEPEAIEAGVKVGAVLAAGPGAILGGILAKVASDVAQKKIKEEVDAVVTKEIIKASALLDATATKQIAPRIAKVRDLEDELLTTEIPVVHRSLEQLMALAGISLDVRTTVKSGNIHTVVTTRFKPPAKGRTLKGKIRFPKSKCVFGEVTDSVLGHSKVPLSVEDINVGLAGKSCASLISATQLRRATYLGESPSKHLGGNENELPSWMAGGSLSTSGNVVDGGGYYECPYTFSGLPDTSIMELGVVEGSELAKRLDVHAFHDRFLLAHLAGVPLLLDAKGKPLSPLALDFGGASPTKVEDCPSSGSPGNGQTRPKGFELSDRVNPDKCPMCGVIGVWNHRESLTRPGDWIPVTAGAALEQVLGAARTQAAKQLGALPLQRAGLRAGRAAQRRAKAPAKLPEFDVDIVLEGRPTGRATAGRAQ